MKVEINLKIILLGILFFVLKQLDVYLLFILFITLHEMAHLVVGMWLGLRPKVFKINPLGVAVEFYMVQAKSRMKKITTYLAGPSLNFIMGIIFMGVPIKEELKIQIVYTNFLLALFNLIPIMPLDGGKILKELLLKKIGHKQATIVMNHLTQIILVLVTLGYSVWILQIKNFAIFLLILYLWYLKYLEDQKVKTMLKVYEVIERS